MPSSTRSNKNNQLVYTEDPHYLERSLRKDLRSASIDINTCSSTDTARLPQSTETPSSSTDTRTFPSIDINNSLSTDTLHPTSIDTPHLESIDTSRRDMVATIILTTDENGDLRDRDGHLRNAAGQKLNDQREIIPEEETAPIDFIPPADEANRARTLADYNRPDQFYANRSAIRPPAIQRGDFELKPQYYTLVGQIPFCGLSNEHPMDHLERFEDLVTAIKANGVPEDYLLCKLFKYSLSGEASQWLRQLPPGSLTTWSDIKNAFLRNFFDESRAEEWRRKIATFTQDPGESFKDTWNRFKSYQRNCPHHGYNKMQLL